MPGIKGFTTPQRYEIPSYRGAALGHRSETITLEPTYTTALSPETTPKYQFCMHVVVNHPMYFMNANDADMAVINHIYTLQEMLAARNLPEAELDKTQELHDTLNHFSCLLRRVPVYISYRYLPEHVPQPPSHPYALQPQFEPPGRPDPSELSFDQPGE